MSDEPHVAETPDPEGLFASDADRSSVRPPDLEPDDVAVEPAPEPEEVAVEPDVVIADPDVPVAAVLDEGVAEPASEEVVPDAVAPDPDVPVAADPDAPVAALLDEGAARRDDAPSVRPVDLAPADVREDPLDGWDVDGPPPVRDEAPFPTDTVVVAGAGLAGLLGGLLLGGERRGRGAVLGLIAGVAAASVVRRIWRLPGT